MSKKIVFSGGSGLIGSAIINLLQDDYDIINISRRPSKTASAKIKAISWNDKAAMRDAVDGAYAVINLAGASIAGKRWTDDYKEKIYTSRIKTTEYIVETISSVKHPPRRLISASAVGYYGDMGDDIADENTKPGDDFLAKVCADWESEARKAEQYTNVVITRIGIVLDKKEGALAELVRPFKFYAGGWPGSGQQWFSWIHIDDIARMFVQIVKAEKTHSVYNLTSPAPERMKTIVKQIGEILGKPAFLPVPAIAMKLMLGQSAEMVLNGQKALPKNALDDNFSFNFVDSFNALKNILKD